MNANRILIVALLVLAAGITFNQWRLHVAVGRLSAPAAGPADNTGDENAATKLRQAETRFNEARAQLDLAEQRLATANVQLAQLENHVRQLESATAVRRLGNRNPALGMTGELPVDSTARNPDIKRSWGPEQVIGEPDTFQAGDIPTAWASREPDGGEEWLKLEYEKSVDIAEIRVRETHNPGAISKVTAFLAGGSEVTLWEGTEPPAQAPVEMSFTIPTSVNAKSVKVYLDTKRVPGWNEIDAVELIGRDGSHQWAKQASASSTYAEPRLPRLTERLVEFEDRLTR